MSFEQGMLWATEVIALGLQYESVVSASSVCPFSSFPLERVVGSNSLGPSLKSPTEHIFYLFTITFGRSSSSSYMAI